MKKVRTYFGPIDCQVCCYCLAIYCTSMWLLNMIRKREIEREHHIIISYDRDPFYSYRYACHFLNVDYHG